MPTLRPARTAVLRAAVDDARAGQPRLLCIQGASGTGKTTHLRALLETASGFRTLTASGSDAAYRPAYGILEQLGSGHLETEEGSVHNPAIAAQSLRRLIDENSRDDPLVLAIDDAQWADEESLEAVRLLLGRVSGDRLLVVVAHRPFTRGEHRRWQRFCTQPGVATVLTIDGVDLAEAHGIVRETTGTDAPDVLVERLCRHTDGNPMHLRSLLVEYPLAELAAMAELPAPVDVALELTARLAAMDGDSVRLLRTVAVLGSSWVDRIDTATIAGVEEPSIAIELLVDGGLLVERETSPLADVRIVHALVRAAIYQSIPAAERRELHRRAAESLAAPMQRLEHAVAAVERRDGRLADRLEQAATAAHGDADYRREAQLLTWAAQVAESPGQRERDWLEAQLATVLALDTRSVRSRLSEIAWAEDVAHRTLVLAWLLVVENRIADARRTLETLPTVALDAADRRTCSRLVVLTAWCLLVSGYPTEQVSAALQSLPDGEPDDPALMGYYLRTAGQVAAREFDFEHLRADFDAAPVSARETPMELTATLAWRGAVYSLCGFASEARRDLGEVVSRIRGGRVDAGSGANHALHGFALWQDGELDRASIEFQAARDLAPDRVHPLVQAALPLVPAVRGDFARADELIDRSEAVLADLPWREAVAVHVQARVVRLHAGADIAARTSCLDRLRTVFGAGCTSADDAQGAIWHLHLALARIWAGELDDVEAHLSAIETDMIVPDWSAWARPWLTGLRDERAGDLDAARQGLDTAAAALNSELPLYRGHVHADRARVAAHLGDDATAARAVSQAREQYARLGATPYLDRVRTDTSSRESDVLHPLSDREREVAALLLSGFSYAQIAEQLYVTRSTVAFHLGNIYAKTGVGSRHELIELARGASR